VPRERLVVDGVPVPARSGAFLLTDRSLVSWPNPVLANEFTCRRISSMEGDWSSPAVDWSPKTSQRIFSFCTGRFRFFADLLPPQTVDIFMYALLPA